MWFEERSWSLNHMKMSSLIVEEWRDIWSYKAEFMLIGWAYVFATTNFLNFPRLILENGGLAFLAAYGAVLAIVVLPIIVMELAVGQLTGRAPVQALYNICPTLKGVGVAQLVFSLFVLACMTRYLAWLFLYIFYFFWSIFDDRPGLPWLHCKNFPELQVPGLPCREPASVRSVQSASDRIVTTTLPVDTTIITTTTMSTTTSLMLLNDNATDTGAAIVDALTSNMASIVDDNVTSALTAVASALLGDELMLSDDPAPAQNRLNTLHAESALNHFMRSLEQPSDSIADVGQLQMGPLAAQGAVWLLVFIAICFGVRWLGKVVMLTFLTPFALLCVFAARCTFLAGAVDAFQTFFWDSTDWRKLEDYMVWKTAAEQAILATGVGFGAFITIGSYNKHSNNLVRDSALLVFGHALITVLQTAAVVSLIGYVSVRTGLRAHELLENGEGQMWQMIAYMAFVPHTKVFTAILLIYCALSLINVFYLLSLSLLASLEDALGQRWTNCCRGFMLALLVSLLGAAISLYFVTQAGMHAYELATGFLKYVTLEVILAFELIAVSWFYCAHSLGKNLRTMLASSVAWCLGYFLLIFTYLLPAVPIAIGVANVWAYSFERSYSVAIRNWAPWSQLVGIAIAVLPLVPIPWCSIRALWRTCRYPSQATRLQRLRHAFRSPMHYDLVKSGDGGSLVEEGGIAKTGSGRAVQSPRYSAAAPGYVLLLPQQQPAPLAQPEHYYSSTPTGVAPSTATTTMASRP